MIDTKSYMVGAYTVATIIYVAYMVSLWSRARRVIRNVAVAVEEKREVR